MKLKPFIPIIASLILFGIFLAIPVSWFTGLINSKTLETQRISLSDQVLKGTLIQDKMYESDAYNNPKMLRILIFHLSQIIN